MARAIRVDSSRRMQFMRAVFSREVYKLSEIGHPQTNDLSVYQNCSFFWEHQDISRHPIFQTNHLSHLTWMYCTNLYHTRPHSGTIPVPVDISQAFDIVPPIYLILRCIIVHHTVGYIPFLFPLYSRYGWFHQHLKRGSLLFDKSTRKDSESCW
jgi:hypothetical protein